MDTLSILVKPSGFKGNVDLLQKNVKSIFNFPNIVDTLFNQINDDLYSSLIVMEILRESLKVDQVCFIFRTAHR